MKKSSRNFMTRRRFLADCGKMTGIGAMSSMLSLSMVNKLFAARTPGSVTDYKGLVCIFLFGGNDSYNMLAPGVSGYADYLATRGVLGIPLADTHQIIESSQDYHLNTSLADLKTLFDNEDLSFITNVGTLIQPTTLSEYSSGSVPLPYGRFSHNDQLEQWQTSISTSKTGPFAGTGWGGRMIDILNDAANNNATTSVSLAPYGANTYQVGNSSSPFNTRGGVNSLDLYKTDSLVKLGMDATLETQYASVLQAHHNYIREDALAQSELLEQIEQNTVISTVFPDSSLGQQLLQIAKYIKSQGIDALNANRQTFFAGQTGFDTHGGGIDTHNSLMTTLNDALVAFNAALKEIGYHDRVVTYTASDFGRSLTPNSVGSDHGWGGNQLVMGGPVQGGKVFGTYPDIALNTTTDVGRGRQLPTTSVDELHASLAYWFGVENNSEMETVVPNIRNFWTSGSTETPIAGLFA
ncbi:MULTISPECIES: DUF1501 domain-containing protein [unclassified Lentimonas]|uniref:DUF1501 domain-containing protein n=1 Tax=unclassified Lentimonas TaxID=2630993 RepID=UPI0013897C1B|nr:MULTISPECIES: DUF1501 domain-containing protein [unclassified Lentimonas]